VSPHRSAAEEVFAAVMRTKCGEAAEREYRFHPTRKWRFDFAWPAYKVAVEIDGRGRHQTVDGVRKDCEKHNEAVILGWAVLRFPATDKGKVFQWADLACTVLLNRGASGVLNPF
jgi:very-short-patch-repair endonuclease